MKEQKNGINLEKLKGKEWTIIAGVIFAVTVVITALLLFKVVGLDMLPTKYVILVIGMLVLVLAAVFAAFFLLPLKKKETKYIIRGIAMLLAVVLVVVDIVGIQMVNKFENTVSDMVDNKDEPKVEEYQIGVYVRTKDKATTLEDAKRYDFGYSLAFDSNNIQTAINMMENELDRNLELEEFASVSEAVDAVLSKEKDALIISEEYFDVIEGQEGYENLSEQIKCIHTCVVTIEIEVSEKEETPLVVTKDAFIVYLSGFDTTRNVKRANSDVNILAVVNPTTKQVLLLNTPRDYYVPISISDKGTLDKLTHCGVYGVDCSIDTLNEFYDIDISYYAQINFSGFVKLIDAIGGITVYSEKDFQVAEDIKFHKGDNHVNGIQALAFVRERKLFGDGDNARGRHQMVVIKAIISKLLSGSLLTNYADILDSMGKSFRCDITQEEISALVKMQLGDMAQWNIQSYAVVGDGDGELNYTYTMPKRKVYVMPPDKASVEHAKKLIKMVYDGEIIDSDDLKYK